MLEQIIWNNLFVKVGGKSVFYTSWHEAGIKQVKHLFNEQENCFLSLESFRNKFNIQCNFLQYYALVSSIPSAWKKLLLVETQHTITEPFSNKMLTCKTIYDNANYSSFKNYLRPRLKNDLKTTASSRKTISKCISYHSRLPKRSNLSCSNTKSSIIFYSQTVYSINCKKVLSPNCPFCPSVGQTIHHLFVDCSQASTFWCEFQNWLFQLCNIAITLSPIDVLYGVIRQPISPCLALNHLTILGKYFLYTNALNKK